MPPRDRGFTIAFIPHSAHGKRREFRVPGGAAPFFRLGVVFLLIIGGGGLRLLDRRLQPGKDPESGPAGRGTSGFPGRRR